MVMKERNNKPLHILQGHTHTIKNIEFSADSQWLLTDSEDKSARLWHVDSGKQKQVFHGEDAALSPDGRFVVTMSSDETMYLWNAQTGTQIAKLEEREEKATTITFLSRIPLAFSLDGNYLATGSTDRTVIRMWYTKTGALKQVFTGHTDTIRQVAFSPDGFLLASASDDDTAIIWNTQTGEKVHILKHDDFVDSVVFSPDGLYLATRTLVMTDVRLWLIQTGKLIATLPQCESPIFLPDRKHLMAYSRSKKFIGTWNTKAGAVVSKVTLETNHDESVNLSPDGRLAALSTANNTLAIYNEKTGKQERVLEGHIDDEFMPTFSPDGSIIAATSHGQTVLLWRVD